MKNLLATWVDLDDNDAFSRYWTCFSQKYLNDLQPKEVLFKFMFIEKWVKKGLSLVEADIIYKKSTLVELEDNDAFARYWTWSS